MRNIVTIANAISHTHLQFATANATPKIAKEYVLPTLTFKLKKKHRKTKQNVESQQVTMYKNNSGLIAKTKVSKYKKKFVFNRKVSA